MNTSDDILRHSFCERSLEEKLQIKKLGTEPPPGTHQMRGSCGSTGRLVGYPVRRPRFESQSGPSQFFIAPLCPSSTKMERQEKREEAERHEKKEEAERQAREKKEEAERQAREKKEEADRKERLELENMKLDAEMKLLQAKIEAGIIKNEPDGSGARSRDAGAKHPKLPSFQDGRDDLDIWLTRRTKDKVLSNFYWPGVDGDVTRYCRSCDVCQRTVKKGTVPREGVPD
ncbi:Zinc finger protein [Plakobranchus ocellatus]|uniref:Zinc finger protein n=1 Tax=Plakobranchus ocellatus TaxID=259542 RepID=A0AAV4DS52_9GAST|nr:Zinc finger protein [Plakobranchus ocellatus]